MNKIKTFFSDLWYMRMTLLKHLVAVVGITALLIGGIMWILNLYTLHGESVEVPDLNNMNIEDAQRLLATRDLEIEVLDSICKGGGLGGVIKDQTPRANARVKESRKIYITVTGYTDCTASIYYKDLIGRSLDYVRRQMKRSKIKIGKNPKYIPGGRAENTVTEVYIKGQPVFIEANPEKGQIPPSEPVKIPHGTTIDLVLWEGIDSEPKYIPKLNCRRYSEAEFAITGSKFLLGDMHYTGTISDTLSAWVWKQSPAPHSRATMGTGIDLWLMSEKPQGCIDEELEAQREAARQDSIKRLGEMNPFGT